MERTQLRFFETEEDLRDEMIRRGASGEGLVRDLVHEREHARKAHELGYKNIKWGYQVTFDDKTREVLDWRYLIKVEGVTPEDAARIAEAPKKLSDLDEMALISKALDDVGYPRGYIDENGNNIPSS